MAKQAKSSKGGSETKVTRISASDSKPAKAVTKKVKPAVQAKKTVATSDDQPAKKNKNPFAPIARYLKGSWYELRQVRWPDRRSTWGMTGALLLFTAFFVIVILLLDYGFSYLFKLIMGNN